MHYDNGMIVACETIQEFAVELQYGEFDFEEEAKL